MTKGKRNGLINMRKRADEAGAILLFNLFPAKARLFYCNAKSPDVVLL
jgi:hypothetical protein